MKWLCLCQYGHSRSVALARRLHHRGIPAVAAGVGTGGDAIAALAEWADTIAVLEPHFAASVPAQHRHKVVVFNVGRDRWSNPYHPELLGILEEMLAKHLAAEV